MNPISPTGTATPPSTIVFTTHRRRHSPGPAQRKKSEGLKPPASATTPSRFCVQFLEALRPRHQRRNRQTGAPLDFISIPPQRQSKFVTVMS